MDKMYWGIYVEQMPSGKWAVCWPDGTYLQSNIGSKSAATKALYQYQGKYD